jgi:hypothetical protein
MHIRVKTLTTNHVTTHEQLTQALEQDHRTVVSLPTAFLEYLRDVLEKDARELSQGYDLDDLDQFIEDFEPYDDLEQRIAKLAEGDAINDLLGMLFAGYAEPEEWDATYTRRITAWTESQAREKAEDDCDQDFCLEDIERAY